VAFCAICGQDHEPGVPCAAGWIHVEKTNPKQAAESERGARRLMIWLGLAFLIVLVIPMIIAFILKFV
jgi:hypothetical protein